MFGILYPYGIVLQAVAILHFVRRRPETYWIWVILMFGGIGALIYLAEHNYACFLADEGRVAEAREWAERILRKKATMPDYIRRRERPWFRQAGALLKRLP